MSLYHHLRLWSLTLVSVSALALGSATAQTATEWATRAEQHYREGRYAESADCYARSMEAGAKNPVTFYNAACSAALADRVDAAFAHLNGALERGWRDAVLMAGDRDLAGLRDDPRWGDVLARCHQAEADFLASLELPWIRTELLEMRRLDQAVRTGEDLPELRAMGGMMEVDAIHTARMREIVAEYGWPTASKVGEDGASSAWLLVQHADADPSFQRECLELMKAAAPGEVSAVDVAYLTDRVLVNEGKKQIYGTQFWTVDGQNVPRPIEDEAGVEERRAALGMISMKEYTARMSRHR